MDKEGGERMERVSEETSKLIDAHCFRCGERLRLVRGWFECPEHGRGWVPDNLRF